MHRLRPGGRRTLRHTWLIAAAGFVASTAAQAEQLTVDIVDVKRIGGHLMVALYDNAKAWDASSRPVAAARDSVTGSRVRVLFSGLAPGRYAVKLFHDENNNGRLDSNMLGIPVESYGFSGNGGVFGPPSFDDAAFDLREDATITIGLN